MCVELLLRARRREVVDRSEEKKGKYIDRYSILY